MKFPADEFAQDWMTLHEWYVLHQPPSCGGPLECEEDWAIVRGLNRWFVALFDENKNPIPGTLATYANPPPYWAGLFTATKGAVALFVGSWAVDEKPTLVPLEKPVTLGPITPTEAICVYTGDVGYRFITKSSVPIVTGNGPINISAITTVQNTYNTITLTEGTAGYFTVGTALNFTTEDFTVNHTFSRIS